MYQLGYYEHYLTLKRKYPFLERPYPRDWCLKDYGALFAYDTITTRKARRVLEVGCGYDTFFAELMAKLQIEYWYIDRSNDYLGIHGDLARFKEAAAKRASMGATFVDGLLGDPSASTLPADFFDVVFSISVVEHMDDAQMPAITKQVFQCLSPGGCSAHSIDIYPRSTKARQWHIASKMNGFEVPLPYYDAWSFEGPYTTFIEQPKIRYLFYNRLRYKDPLAEKAPYGSQFATLLSLAVRPSGKPASP